MTQHNDTSNDVARKAPRNRRILRFGLVGLVAGAAIAALVAVPAAAGGDSARGVATPKKVRAKMDRGADFAMEILDGSDAQRKSLDPILDRVANDMANFRNEGRALRKSFVTAILADKLDDKHLDKIRGESIKLADRMTNRMLKELKQVHAILTPEQRAKLRRMVAKAEKRWSKR